MSELDRWIDYIFNHPVTGPEWYHAEDAPPWAGSPDQIPALISETFERAGELLAPFPDDRLNQGFWCLHFSDITVAEAAKATPRVVRSFIPLFEQLMTPRCTPHLGHLSEKGGSPLNESCYMWWDSLRFDLWHGTPHCTPWSSLHDEIVITQQRLLAIPHDACHESALHGLGHLIHDYPERRGELTRVVDELLWRNPDLRPELIAYAAQAKAGQIL